MINKINASRQNQINFKQNQPTQIEQQKSKFSEFKDCFVKDAKNTLPMSLAIAGIWSLFEIGKNKGKLGQMLMSNIVTFASASLVFSGVEALFKVNYKKPQ